MSVFVSGVKYIHHSVSLTLSTCCLASVHAYFCCGGRIWPIVLRDLTLLASFSLFHFAPALNFSLVFLPLSVPSLLPSEPSPLLSEISLPPFKNFLFLLFCFPTSLSSAFCLHSLLVCSLRLPYHRLLLCGERYCWSLLVQPLVALALVL